MAPVDVGMVALTVFSVTALVFGYACCVMAGRSGGENGGPRE